MKTTRAAKDYKTCFLTADSGPVGNLCSMFKKKKGGGWGGGLGGFERR